MKEAKVLPGEVQSEVRRTLAPVLFAESTTKTLDIPRDTVIKHAIIRMDISFSVPYSSGSPISDAAGVMERLIPRIDVVANGQDTIKSVSPYLMSRQQLLLQGNLAERAYSTSAAAPTTRLAQTEKTYGEPFVYPATTNFVLVNESIIIYFEMPHAYTFGRESTMFNTKGLASAEFRFTFGSLSAVQRAESSPVSITYGLDVGNVVVTLVEAQHIAREARFNYFKETVKSFNFTGEQRDFNIELSRGGFLTGLMLQVRNGDANKSLSDIAVTDVSLLINGQRIVQKTKFIPLQQGNRARFGINAAKGSASAGATHVLQGFAFMNLLLNGDIRTALNTQMNAGVDQLYLQVSTAPASGTDAATYTNPVELRLLQQEISGPSVRI